MNAEGVTELTVLEILPLWFNSFSIFWDATLFGPHENLLANVWWPELREH